MFTEDWRKNNHFTTCGSYLTSRNLRVQDMKQHHGIKQKTKEQWRYCHKPPSEREVVSEANRKEPTCTNKKHSFYGEYDAKLPLAPPCSAALRGASLLPEEG